MSRPLKMLVVGVAFLPFAGCPQPDSTRSFTATLTGAQEVPPVTTTASGSATFTLSADQTDLTYSITAQNFSSAVTAAHFHLAAPGVNGGVVEDIGANIVGDSAALTIQGTFADLGADELAALLAGNLYVNIHTTNFPGGEIRGQLTAAP